MLVNIVKQLYSIGRSVMGLELPVAEFRLSMWELFVGGILITMFLGFVFSLFGTKE